MKRSEIESICSELAGLDEPLIELREYLDDIEQKVQELAKLLDIKGVGDLGQIEEAKTIADTLADDLY